MSRSLRRSKRLRSERGAVLIEFAFAVVILSFLLLAGIDLDLLALARQHVDFIAADSATCFARGCDPIALAQQNGSGLNMDLSQLTVTVDNAAKTVTVVYTQQPISPFFPSPWTLTATATGS